MKRFKFLLAYCDEDGIHNCEKGTLTYFHEYGHYLQLQNKIIKEIWKWLPSMTGIAGLCMLSTVILWREPLMLVFGGIIVIPISSMLLYMEVDAWIYAFKEYFKKKKQNDKI